jgi:flavodoxin
LYWTAGGNTEKVARAAERGLKSAGVAPEVRLFADAGDIDLHAYDLVLLGAPSYHFLPPQPVLDWIKDRMAFHRQRGDIKPAAPEMSGKRAVVFITYSGQHTGIDEATTAGDYLGQFLAHIGIRVAEKWYVVGKFHGNEAASTLGRLGDIRHRPNTEDLKRIERAAAALV